MIKKIRLKKKDLKFEIDCLMSKQGMLETRIKVLEANIRGLNTFNMGFQQQLETIRREFEVLKKITLEIKRCPKCQGVKDEQS